MERESWTGSSKEDGAKGDRSLPEAGGVPGGEGKEGIVRNNGGFSAAASGHDWEEAECVPVRVLVLEDSEWDAADLMNQIRAGGVMCEMRTERTRAGFEAGLREFTPTAVLADYKHPFYGAELLLASVRALCPGVPVIFITGPLEDTAAVELLKAGATDLVHRDGLARLVPALRRALREVEESRRLQETRVALMSCNLDLERRVRERTREVCEKNRIMEEHLLMAHELQATLLPRRFPTIPPGVEQGRSALRIFNFYRPFNFVAGDCFYVTRVSPSALGLFVCDVMGHGVRAALVAAMLRALQEQLAEKAVDPALVLAEMNRALCHIFEEAETLVFATACAFTLDVSSQTLLMANAGHPSPILVCDNKKRVEVLESAGTRGPALGVFPSAQYGVSVHPLQTGDILFAFTDGIFEVTDRREELFGRTRLREAFERNLALEPRALLKAVVTEVEEFAAGNRFLDDVCVVGVEVGALSGQIPESNTGKTPARMDHTSAPKTQTV